MKLIPLTEDLFFEDDTVSIGNIRSALKGLKNELGESYVTEEWAWQTHEIIEAINKWFPAFREGNKNG